MQGKATKTVEDVEERLNEESPKRLWEGWHKQPRVSREGDGAGEHRTVIHQISPTGNTYFFM